MTNQEKLTKEQNARLSVVLPLKLKVQMLEIKEVDWSEIAVKAFEAHIRFMFGAENTLQEGLKKRIGEIVDEMLS